MGMIELPVPQAPAYNVGMEWDKSGTVTVFADSLASSSSDVSVNGDVVEIDFDAEGISVLQLSKSNPPVLYQIHIVDYPGDQELVQGLAFFY